MKGARLVVGLSLLLACRGPARAPGDNTPLLEEEEVRAEIAQVERAMREAYASKILVPTAAWDSLDSIVKRLAEIPKEPQPARALCEAIDEALRPTPSVQILDERGERCVRGGIAKYAPVPSENIATKAEGGATVEEFPHSVIAIGIHHFGAETVLPEAQLDRARAVIVDLREAAGDDPRAAIRLLEHLLGMKSLRPLRSIEVASGAILTKLRAEIPVERLRVQAVWQGLVGSDQAIPGGPARPRMAELPIYVLVGGRCDGPCQLVARALARSGNAQVVGLSTGGGPLFLADHGELVLGRSSLRLRIPTARYAASSEFRALESAEGIAGTWRLPLPPLSGFHGVKDPFEQALAVARTEIDRRARVHRFNLAPPKSCSELPEVPTPNELSEEARNRLSGGVVPAGPTVARVYLTLSRERARTFLAECPGLDVGHIGEHPTLSIVDLRRSPFPALSRLLASDAVELIAVEPKARMRPLSQ